MTVTYCASCAMHNHANCSGGCACARRAHVPDVETAAAMRRYERPDQHREPVERLASDWHRKDERAHGTPGPVTLTVTVTADLEPASAPTGTLFG